MTRNSSCAKEFVNRHELSNHHDRRAKAEVDVIYQFIAERSEQGAIHWLRAFQAARDELGENPERFGWAPENERIRENIRQRFFSTRNGNRYRIIFNVVGNNIFVLHMRGFGQDNIA